jgi:hypothetical protein
MLFRRRIKEMTSQQLISIGLALMMLAVGLSTVGSHWLDGSDFTAGFFMGFASVLMGTSIVFNIQGLKRYRTEKARR